MNARTGSLPWDLSGRAKTPEEYEVWLEKRRLQREEYKAWLEKRERQRADKDQDSTALMPPRTET